MSKVGKYVGKYEQKIDSEKLTWLANEIFTAFPRDVTGLKFYVLDCGCIHYQRVFPDGTVDTKTGIYRDAKHGSCEICLLHHETWEERSRDEIIVYNSKFQVEVKGQ